jgi:hypothetical protein
MSRHLLSSFVVLAFLSGASCASVFAPSPFAVEKTRNTAVATRESPRAKQLEVRGGAGPISAETAAKLYGGLMLAQGAAVTLAPGPALEAFGGSSKNPVNKKLMMRTGLTLLSQGILAYCMLFNNFGINRAFFLVGIMWAAEALRSIMNGEPSTIGPTIARELTSLAFWLPTIYATMKNLDCASDARKVVSVFALLSGLSCVNAKFGAKFWDITTDSLGEALVSSIGIYFLTLGVASCSLAWNGDIVKAMGHASLALLIGGIKLRFVTKEADKFEATKSFHGSKISDSIGLVLLTVIAASILLVKE